MARFRTKRCVLFVTVTVVVVFMLRTFLMAGEMSGNANGSKNHQPNQANKLVRRLRISTQIVLTPLHCMWPQQVPGCAFLYSQVTNSSMYSHSRVQSRLLNCHNVIAHSWLQNWAWLSPTCLVWLRIAKSLSLATQVGLGLIWSWIEWVSIILVFN